jgi:murein DD-endopeptidase MepM/ murein hydrolase activator NlpD
MESLRLVQNVIRNNISAVFQTKNVLEQNKTAEQLVQDQLQKEKDKLKVKQTSLAITKDAQSKELAVTKGKESNFRNIIADRQKQKDAFEKEVFDYENKLKYVLNPSSIPKENTSALGWPLEKILVTQQFGKTVGAERLYASGSHNGTDFRAVIGTPVLSMGDGTLVAQGDTDLTCKGVSFGGWILIKYDDGLASTYGHLSKFNIVSSGSRVSKGDIVGYSGNTGYTTGPHLHVSMYPAGAVNATARPSSSCPGRDLTMPIAPVNAYLDPLAYMPK